MRTLALLCLVLLAGCVGSAREEGFVGTGPASFLYSAHTNTVMIEQAKRVIVIADSSKIGRVAFARMCTLAQVDELITNRSGADRAEVRKLTDVGVRVTFV